jgi:hypothetical protein
MKTWFYHEKNGWQWNRFFFKETFLLQFLSKHKVENEIFLWKNKADCCFSKLLMIIQVEHKIFRNNCWTWSCVYHQWAGHCVSCILTLKMLFLQMTWFLELMIFLFSKLAAMISSMETIGRTIVDFLANYFRRENCIISLMI